MAAANLLWGTPHIHGELLKLGIDIAERTVSRLMPRRRASPCQTWRTFLANHILDVVSIDFFTVSAVGLRVRFVLDVLAHHRRRVVHFDVTAHPAARWTAQQVVDAFPDKSAPPYLLRDRDCVYGQPFLQRVKDVGIEDVLAAPLRGRSRGGLACLLSLINRESSGPAHRFQSGNHGRHVTSPARCRGLEPRLAPSRSADLLAKDRWATSRGGTPKARQRRGRRVAP